MQPDDSQAPPQAQQTPPQEPQLPPAQQAEPTKASGDAAADGGVPAKTLSEAAPQESAGDMLGDAATLEMPAMRSGLLTVAMSMDGFEGGTVEEQVRLLTARRGVVVFSKSHCPFCLEVKRTFADLGVAALVLEMDKMRNGAQVHKALKAQSKHMTVPNVYIDGAHIGGCDDVKRLQASGELQTRVAALAFVPRTEGGGAGDLHALRFSRAERGEAIKAPVLAPDFADFKAVRLTAFFVVVLCCLSIGFREEPWGRWLAVFLLADFASRLLAGGGASILAQLSALLLVPFEPDFRAGPPQQFAAFCGLAFSTTAVGCYFGGAVTAGAVVLGLLIGAAALQAFTGVCVGCIFFGLGIRFGLVPNTIHRVFSNTRAETSASYHYLVDASGAPRPTPVPRDPSNAAAVSYKAGRSEEWSKDDFHLVRHAHVGYFAVPLSLAGLAVAWKMASHWLVGWAAALPAPLGQAPVRSLGAPLAWSHTFAIAAGVCFALMLALYALRLCLYPHKVWMDWTSPSRHAGFGMATISLMLFGFLAYDAQDVDSDFGRALWWLGAVPHMLLTVAKFGEIVGKRGDMEHVQPSWLVLPVGNLVAALVAPVIPALRRDADGSAAQTAAYGPDFATLEITGFFFSFGLLMWVVLLTVTFFKAATSHNSSDAGRLMLYVWVAAPCVAGLASLVLRASRGNEGGSLALVTDFSQFFFVGLVFALGLGWAWLPYVGFYGRAKFDMSYWALCFPLDTLAAAAAVYYGLSDFAVARVLAIALLALATGANLLALLHTLVALARRRGIFTPEKRFGPMGFMYLLHEALRGGVPQLLRDVAAADMRNPESLRVVATHVAQLEVVHEEHSRHEDDVMFKHVADLFPGHTRDADGDHVGHRADFRRWLQDAQALLDAANAQQQDGADSAGPGSGSSVDVAATEQHGEQHGEQLAGTEQQQEQHQAPQRAAAAAEALARLQKELPGFAEHLLEHLRSEEAHITPVAKRYTPLALQVELTRRCFHMTSAAAWETMLPYVINNLPRHPQRVMYLRSLLWALPERAQQIGAIVYRNCDAVMWARLAVEVPEMIPRGVSGWWRYD